ncbi:hypothetical protein P168DRAFT_280530 [Aspergillus campestris IBT 28561]|uniref:Mucin family signaling protein Msb2 n=1 Tax=Aspergillus campestris (strain IBT 28561) TaxID=1392248 RepID=A0A2I1D6W3_ASPC2|nr:uncharacterized protein P168DRAFT_280530 [Aspergillus campestris IBT 28561]PKY05621.1 hypothetical protein P168DRAFT_280530 [Aspergillus campestris IBT 28561]
MVASVASFLAAFLSVGGLELVAAQQAPDSHAMKRRFVPKHMKRYINYQRSEDGKPLDDFLEKAGLGTKTTAANPPPPPPTETTLPAVVVTLSIDKDGKTHTISGPLPAGATIASATTNVVTITGPGAAAAAPTSHKDTVPAPSEKEAAASDSTTHHALTANKEAPDAPAASSSSPATDSKDSGFLDDVKSFFGVSSSTDSTEASSTTSDSKPAPSSDSKAAASSDSKSASSSDSKHAPSDASSASITPTPESTEGSFLDDVKSFFGDTSSTDSVSATSSASDSKSASSAASGSSVTPTASSTDGGLLDDFKSFFGDPSSTDSPSSGTPPVFPLSSTADASTTKASSTSTPGASSSKSTTNLLDAFTDLFNPDTPASSATHAPSANASTSGLSATPTSVPLPSTSSGLFNLPSEMSSLLGWTSGLESSGPQSTLPPGAATSSALFPGASSGSTGSVPFTLINPSVPTTTPGGASSTDGTGAHGSTTGGSTAPPTAKPTGKPTSPGSPTSAPSTAPPTHPPSSTSTETPTSTSETTSTSTPPPETTEAPTPTPSNPDDWVDNTIIFETQTHVVPDPAATQTTSESTSQPTALPGSITPPTFGNIPENSTLIQLGFTRELSYDFVATHTMSSSQIFRYIPLGLQHALRLAADQVAMFAIQPYGNESRDGYLTTLAMAYVPWDQIDTLRKYLHNPISPLYEQPSESEKRLFSLIDPSIPLLVSGEPAAGGSSGDQSGSSHGGSDGSDGDDSQTDSGDAGASSSSSTKASSVGIGCGVVAGAAAYGAGMFWLARRYRKKRQLHQRSSSTVDQQSEARGAAGRLSPNSQGSRGPISAPVMAENSLGWN